MYAACKCRPYDIECDNPASRVYVSMCCGKEIPLCTMHADEADASDEMDPMYHCVLCGQQYTDNSWIVIPITLERGSDV